MRLQTEAFIDTAAGPWAIILGMLAVLVCSVFLYHSDRNVAPVVRIVFWTILGFNVMFLVINSISIITATSTEDQLNADLKSQLGIEKVSYDDEYRELTGEKDGKVVSCLLAEEGDRGNVYEVICR